MRIVTTAFAGLRRLSSTLGVFLTLVGAPAALFGAYAFHGEIIDTVTAPDLRFSAPRMTLRCFIRFNRQDELNAFIATGDPEIEARVCGRNWLSVGFLATIDNDDRIERTITDISARLHLPDGAPADMVVLDLPWTAVGEIAGVTDTNVRRTFTLLRIPPKTTMAQEIWIAQAAPVSERVNWAAVRGWLSSDARPGQEVTTEIFLQVAGQPEPILAATCSFPLREDSLATYRGWALNERRAFTGACD